MTKENKISMDSTTCVIPTEKRTVDHGTSQYTYWLVITIGAVVLLLMALGTVIAVIDPYFHYHAPKDGWYYLLYDERYINDGIVRHFDYDTIITGTSMTQNFKTSECDAIFDCESVKVPFSGGGFKEINENLKRAFAAKDDIRYVIRGLDTGGLSQDKDWARYGEYPTYLTNNNPFDDVYYLLNKEVLFGDALQMAIETAYGTRPTTFDAYNNWMAGRTFGKEAVLATYGVNEPPAEEVVLTEAEEALHPGKYSAKCHRTDATGAKHYILLFLDAIQHLLVGSALYGRHHSMEY